MADVDEVASLRGHVARCKVHHERDYADLVNGIDALASKVQGVSLAFEQQERRLGSVEVALGAVERRLAWVNRIGLALLVAQLIAVLL
jgi:hypothetical protein